MRRGRWAGFPAYCNAAWDDDELTPSLKLTILAVARFADRSGCAVVSKQTIARKTGLSLSQMKRLLPELVDRGWLDAERRDSHGKDLATSYRLTIPAVDKAVDDSVDSAGDNVGSGVTMNPPWGHHEPTKWGHHEPTSNKNKNSNGATHLTAKLDQLGTMPD